VTQQPLFAGKVGWKVPRFEQNNWIILALAFRGMGLLDSHGSGLCFRKPSGELDRDFGRFTQSPEINDERAPSLGEADSDK
jgi:hypothetical protein